MTPLHLKMALHYYCHTDDYEDGRGDHFHSEATQKYLSELVDAEILIKNGGGRPFYRQNKDPMLAFIKALCAVNLPVKKWVVE